MSHHSSSMPPSIHPHGLLLPAGLEGEKRLFLGGTKKSFWFPPSIFRCYPKSVGFFFFRHFSLFHFKLQQDAP